MSTESHSNYLRNKDLDNFSKTGYSNSRLSVPIWDTPQPKLSFDAMTIVGNLDKNNAQKLSEFMSLEPQIRLWDMVKGMVKPGGPTCQWVNPVLERACA